MSIELEKQSLSTLKEWATSLGIRGVSNARKSELVDLLTRVGEKRVEYAISMTQKKEEAQKEDPPKAPARKKKEPAGKSSPERPKRATAPKENRPSYSPAPLSNRGGFGSYAPSYRAQLENNEAGNGSREIEDMFEGKSDEE